MIWFTSDTHYHHKNIVRGTSEWEIAQTGSHQSVRDFDTLEEHNKTLVDNFNNLVKKDDVLYHLGDWSFGGFDKILEFREQLNCENIHLIFGNHDHHIEANKIIHEGHDGLLRTQDLFKSVAHYRELAINGQKIILCHYAMRVWNKSHHNSFHLYGHSHATLSDYGKSMDVGIDSAYKLVGNYRPFSFTEVQSILSKRDTTIIDHHNSQTN